MDNQREVAEFNDAIGYLQRINVLFYKAQIAAGNLDMYNWLHALMGIERELSTKVKNDKELQELEYLRNEIATEVNKAMLGRHAQHISPALYNKLHHFEIRLRQLYKDSGLEMKFKDDPNHAIG